MHDGFGRKAIGIEFRDDSTTAVLLRKGFSGVELVSSLTLELNALEAEEDALPELDAFVSANGMGNSTVFVSISPKWGLLRFIDVPVQSEDALGRLIHYEVERHIPFSMEDVCYDYHVAARDGEICRVVLAVVERQRIENIRRFLARLTLRPGLITLSPLSALNALDPGGYKGGFFSALTGLTGRPGLFSDDNRVSLCLFLGDSRWDLVVLQGAVPVHLESVAPFAGEGGEDLYDDFFNGVDRTLSRLSLGKPGRIVLAGRGSAALGRYAAAREGLEVRVVDAFPSLAAGDGGSDHHGLLPAAGAALAGLGLGGVRPDLLRGTSSGNAKAGPLVMKVLLVVILLLSCGLLTSVVVTKKRILEVTEEEIVRNEPALAAVEALRAELDAAVRKRDFLSGMSRGDRSRLEILAELTDIIPGDAWLTRFDFREAEGEGRDGEVVMAGFARSSSMLISLLEGSDLFEDVEFVGPVTKGPQGEGFKIKARVRRRTGRLRPALSDAGA